MALHLSTEDGADVDLLGGSIRSAIAVRRQKERSSNMAVHYLEIVSNDVATLTGLYQRMHGLSFGPPDPDLGQARVATRADGSSGRNRSRLKRSVWSWL